MPHVDEGALHAYLDGALDEYPADEAARIRAHLEACETCAARLEAEARVRDDASAILGSAVPPLDAPPLEELRARARARAGRSATASRFYRAGWAASVVLALGTGWLLRGMRPPTQAATGGTVERTVPEVQRPAAPLGTEASSPATEDRATPADEVAEEAPAPVTAPMPAPSPASASAVDASTRGDAQPPPEPSAAGTEPAEVREAARARREVEQSAPPAGDAMRPAALPSAVPAPTRAARSRVATSAAPSDAAPPAVTGVLALDENIVGVGSAPPSLIVPGLVVLSVGWLDEAAPPGTVRVVQLLESGETLELVHLPPGTSPTELGTSAPEGYNELVVPRDGGWAILRADVGADVLRDLADRLGGGRD